MKAATTMSIFPFDFFFISIHAAREGGDFCAFSTFASISAFQSTPPVKAATDDWIYAMDELEISIHAAREGGD